MQHGFLMSWATSYRWPRGGVSALSIGLMLVGTGTAPRMVWAQGAAVQSAGVEGTWQGTLHPPEHDLRLVLKVTKAASGELAGQIVSVDQGGQGIPLSSISLSDGVVKFGVTAPSLKYEGKMTAGGNTLAGTFTPPDGNPLPLSFERATPATAWEIPKPPAPMKPMAADANPSFDVVTVKPSKPDEQGKGFRVQGRRFSTINTSVIEMMDFAYGTHPKQIVNAPAWMSDAKFDIEGTPDAEGAPSDRQWKGMLEKMLAERFQLKFHMDTREMPAYTLTVAKGGPKLEKSQGDPDGLPGLFFQALGVLTVSNANMGDFSQLMQSAVLDRPVVDETKLGGRWNFVLKWTPDETQFIGLGIKMPKPDTPDPPPPLFTAMPEEIGLKLDAVKTAVPVLVIDHAAQPSEN